MKTLAICKMRRRHGEKPVARARKTLIEIDGDSLMLAARRRGCRS
jgi:hypothetical protein